MAAPRSQSLGAHGNFRPGSTTTLTMWFFKFAPGDELGIILEGYKCTDEFGTNMVNWGSSPIVRRINATTLATKSNSQYKLEGPICEKEARALSLPRTLISMFERGFPDNWMTILQAYWNKFRETNAMNASNWFDKTAHLYELSNPLNQDVSRIVTTRPSMARKSILPRHNTVPSPLVEESDSVISTPRSVVATKRKTQSISPQKRPSTSHKATLPPNSSEDFKKGIITEQPEPVTDASSERRSRSRSNSVSTTEVRRSPRLSNPVSKLGSDKPKQQALVVRQRSSTVDSALAKKTLFTPAPVHQMRRAISDNKMNDEAKNQRSNNNCVKPAPIFNQKKKRSSSIVTIRSPAVTGVAPATPKKSSPREKFVAPTPDTRGAGKRTSTILSLKGTDEPVEMASVEIAAEDVPVVNRIESKPSNHQFALSDRPTTSKEMFLSGSSDIARKTDSKWANIREKLGRWCVVLLSDEEIENVKLPELGHPLFLIKGFVGNATEAWQTSPIIDVHVNRNGSYSNLVMTSTKKVYKLEGDMDRKYAHLHGFSKKFLMEFHRGFPSNWVELLWEERRRSRDALSKNANDRRCDATRIVDLTRIATAPVITHPDDELAVIPHTNFSDVPHLPEYQPPLNHDGADIIAVSTTTRTETIANRRSSYGRTIHEPVQQWAGERVRYSANGESMGLEVVNHRRTKPFDDRLAVEKDGKKRTTVKRKMVTYSDGSEDEELLVRNVRLAIEAPKYLNDSDMPIRKRGGSSKDHEIFSDSEDEQNHIEKKIADIQKQKKKLRRQLRALEDMEMKLEEDALQIRKRRSKLRKIREQKARFDQEDGYSRYPPRKAIKAPPPKKSKQTNHVAKKSRPTYDSDDSAFFCLNSDAPNDDKSSTETECSDGGDWRRGHKSTHVRQNVVVKPKKKSSTNKKAPKKKDKNRQSLREYADSDENIFQEDVIESESSDMSSGDDSEEYVDPVDERRKVISWRREDVDKLKRALDAIVIKSVGDWEKISRSMGNVWSPEECREAAIKKLKWTPREPKDAQVETAEPVVEVTSKKGTFKYAKETGQQLRDYMLKGGSQGDDYFRNRDRTDSVEVEDTLEAAEDEPMEVNLDNSLLAAMKTPTVINRKAARRSEFFPDENTPSTSNDRDGSPDEPCVDIPMETVDRDQRTRYLHHLTQQNRSNLNNTTRANNSTFMNQKDADKTLADVTRQVDAIQKKTKQQFKKNKRLTEFEEDDEENEENDIFC